MSNSILVVDDDKTLCENIREYLERQEWDALSCYSGEDAVKAVEALPPDVVIADQHLPGISGTQLIERIRQIAPAAKVIMMTGDDRVQTAVDAMKAGAYDYLTKPVALAQLKLVVDRVAGVRRLETALAFHKQRQAQGAGLDALIGSSPSMRALKQTIEQILEAERSMVDGDLPAILIYGETGTGKELVARSLHVDGARCNGPFVEVNCASIPSHLIESELFGHEKGAFTDAKERRIGLAEAADGGTLFLDEIGEIEPAMQAKLLKLIEEKKVRRIGALRETKVNIRIISATNRNLEQMVREGKFRSDLYYRLRILSLTTPPLRERGQDIVLLARHFLKDHARRYCKSGLSLSPEAEQILVGYPWPGNVREMRNMLEQTVLLSRSPVVMPAQLPVCPGLVPESGCDRNFKDPNSFCMSIPQSGVRLSEVERDLVVKTLQKTDWNVTKSAKLLGLSRDMLRYRIEKLELARPESLPGDDK